MRINPFEPSKAKMYRADNRGYLVEIVIVNPNTQEKALAKQQHRELVAKLGKKKLATLEPEAREILFRKSSLFSMVGSATAKAQPLEWDRKRFISMVLGNTDIINDVRGSTYPTTLPHYARII
ncbi:MAG: hypothetical protein H7234_04140 [Herminiimonas sp.]|nr:hypothetical protein [Herminiimonas sp.]